MSTIIEQPRNDTPIVADSSLLAVPNMNDETARAEYLKKVRALRNPPSAEAESGTQQPQGQPEIVDTVDDSVQPETVDQDVVEESSQDAIENIDVQDTTSNRIRLSPDDLRDYEIPLVDENGEIQYLSYDDFEKTVGLYSKQNKRARELAEREREVEAIRTQLLSEQAQVISNTTQQEQAMAARYQWVQNSLAFAHKHNLDTIKFEDGTTKKVTQLITEKTALENRYAQLQQVKTMAEQKIEQAQTEFVQAQEQVLKERAPNILKSRPDMVKFLERQGFTPDESKALAYSKAELLMIIDKAMRYENAQRGQTKEKKVGSNTKVLKQPSRLAGRGTPVNNPSMTRLQELQSLGSKAKPEELRELRRLQLQMRK